MLLKNGKNLFKTMLGGTSYGGIKDINNTTRNVTFGTLAGSSSGFYVNGQVYVGSGNTPVTEDDYALANDVTASFTQLSNTITYNIDANGNLYAQIVATYKNETESPITIREYAVAGQIRDGWNYYPYIITRVVLETPIEVGAGQSVTITGIIE